MIHHTHVRVYYEDTDMAGIVYYANYLKYMERGRSDAVRLQGMDQLDMRDRLGLVFAVRRVEIDYLTPARFGEVLTVDTWTTGLRGATLEMAQAVRCVDHDAAHDTGTESDPGTAADAFSDASQLPGRMVARATVKVACMTLDGRVTRFPAEIRAQLAAGIVAPRAI